MARPWKAEKKTGGQPVQIAEKLIWPEEQFVLPLNNLQKPATCAAVFAPIKGPVCAEGVHADPCKNSKKWLSPLFRHAQTGGQPVFFI
ncbi:hypothetical protein DW094_09220 [Ruminococcaceae bacterium AM07-15]|nr:hypothetical protein DW094_09220 [Ruminococcaceae bacterium AM07-15]